MAGDPIKVTLLGAERVGKSSMVAALVNGSPANTRRYEATIGASFKEKEIFVDDESVALRIWDTAGQERFFSLMPMYYRGAAIIVLVFDITDQPSFKHLDRLLAQKKLYAPSAPIILVGTKSDLESERKVSTEEAQTFANTHCEGTYIEVTAKKPKDLASTFLAAIVNKLKLHKAGQQMVADLESEQSVSSSLHEPTIQVVSETPSGSLSTFFSGLFSHSPLPPNPYVLTGEVGENEINLSDDFKAIFNHLLNTAWLPNRKTLAAEAILSAGTLNIEALRRHARAESSSRTAQAIRIFDRLNEILNKPIPGHDGDGLRFLNARAFLGGFTNRYLERYAADERRLGIFVRSPEIHGQVTRHELNFDYSDSTVVVQNRIKIIKILYQADEKPNSRTANVVREVLASSGASSSNVSNNRPGSSSSS